MTRETAQMAHNWHESSGSSDICGKCGAMRFWVDHRGRASGSGTGLRFDAKGNFAHATNVEPPCVGELRAWSDIKAERLTVEQRLDSIERILVEYGELLANIRLTTATSRPAQRPSPKARPARTQTQKAARAASSPARPSRRR